MDDYLTITKRYYAAWLDVPPARLDEPGVVAVPSPKREVRQAGYGRRFDLYVYITDQTTVISYHRQLADRVDAVTSSFEQAADLTEARSALAEVLGTCPGHSTKFVFTGLPVGLETGQARALTRDDYPAFLLFHRAQYPHANQDAWLEGYFRGLVDRGYVYGVTVDDRLVSAAEVPDVPYMADLVAEPGINTLVGYRRRGYARVAVGALLKRLLAEGKVPLWSCAVDNKGSHRLAESVGFRGFADVMTVTLVP